MKFFEITKELSLKDITMVRRIIILIVILLILVQFIHPAKNIHPGAQPQAITAAYAVPHPVHTVLQKACYDCHSNNTRYPWYNNIQPVAWWLNHHINEGKRELNFDEFLAYTSKRQNHKLEAVVKQIKADEMPLSSYTWIHKDAILSAEEKKLVMDWADSVRTQVRQKL